MHSFNRPGLFLKKETILIFIEMANLYFADFTSDSATGSLFTSWNPEASLKLI
jgi:hypothetical protein